MNRFKQIVLWLALGAGVICLTGDAPRPGGSGCVPRPGDSEQVWLASVPRPSMAQENEGEIMGLNLRTSRPPNAHIAWKAAVSRAMLQKANWLVNRLNLPVKRPLDTMDVRTGVSFNAGFAILPQPMPSPWPDTIFGTNIDNTNFSRLDRLLALKFGIEGKLDTPDFEFSFHHGQLWNIVRLNPDESDRFAERFDEMMVAPHVHPSLTKTAQAYQVATNWLAAVNVNLAMLEKSRLPHPVRQEESQVPGAAAPQPVYFVAWGTNYYGMYWAYHFWHTNEWHPAVMVEIGPHQELLELYVGDPTFFRTPPMLIPSKTVWRLIHTPDPPLSYLQTPAGMHEFFLTPADVSQYASMYTNGVPIPTWFYQHHLITNSIVNRDISNELKMLNAELIPYTNGQ